MSRPLAIVCGLLGAVITSVTLAVAHWQSAVHLSTEGQVVAGLIAAFGFVLMLTAWSQTRRIEVLVINGITVLVLLGYGYPTLLRMSARSPQKRTMADIRTIATALEARATDVNEYPAVRTLDELAPLLEPTYVKPMPRKDGYRNAFRYEAWRESPKSRGPDHYAIGSAGHDWKFEKSSLRQYTSRTTTNFDCDLVYRNGEWISYPEGVQLDGNPTAAVTPVSQRPPAQETPTNPSVLFDQATGRYKRSDYNAAIPLFERFLRKNPNDALANARLGMSYCMVSRYQDAIPYLQKAIALDPTDYQSRSNLGLVYEKLGNPEQGIEWERKAVALRSNDPVLINNLGWVLLQAHHTAEAVEAFKRAVRLAPNVEQYRENLALAEKQSRR